MPNGPKWQGRFIHPLALVIVPDMCTHIWNGVKRLEIRKHHLSLLDIDVYGGRWCGRTHPPKENQAD